MLPLRRKLLGNRTFDPAGSLKMRERFLALRDLFFLLSGGENRGKYTVRPGSEAATGE
jgi:hypothetical protein